MVLYSRLFHSFSVFFILYFELSSVFVIFKKLSPHRSDTMWCPLFLDVLVQELLFWRSENPLCLPARASLFLRHASVSRVGRCEAGNGPRGRVALSKQVLGVGTATATFESCDLRQVTA